MKIVDKTIHVMEYEAFDKTSFHSEEECKKYEESAKGALYAQYLPLVVEEGLPSKFVGESFVPILFESNMDAVRLKDWNNVNVILQLFIIHNPSVENIQPFAEVVNKAYKENDVLYIARGYNDCYDTPEFWIMGTRGQLIDSLMKV